jgi:hypothetical protein
MFQNAQSYVYSGPNVEVLKVATAVSVEGTILPITPPASNSSWTLDFFGPSLVCKPMESSVRLEVEQNVAEWNRQSSECSYPPVYLAWTPNSPFGENTATPYVSEVINGTLEFSEGIDYGPFTPMYLALMPALQSAQQRAVQNRPVLDCQHYMDSNEAHPLGTDNLTFIQCDLFNASYHANFLYQSGTQQVTLDVDRHEAFENIEGFVGPGIQEANVRVQHCKGLFLNDDSKGPACSFDPEILRRLSYNAVLDAFRRQVMGSITVGADMSEAVATAGFTITSNILETVLGVTKDLGYMRDAIASDVQYSFQSALGHLQDPRAQGLFSTWKQETDLSLTDAIESMFHNLTISLMSSAVLQ